MSSSHMALYRSIWRWHFYAGIIVAPFLFVLAVTGAIYLFNDEINDFLHAETRFADTAGVSRPLGEIAGGALVAFPGGRVTRIDTPTAPGRTYQAFVTPSVGEPVRVFVDPASGRALGSYYYPKTLVGIADQLHGSLLMGDFGDALVELAACWGVILTLTGLYLWWPRGQQRLHQVLFPRLDQRGRRFWKSLHASIGFWSASLIIFLIFTGLPWATIWGDLFRQATKAAGVGYPDSVRAHGAPASTSLTVRDVVGRSTAPWTVEGMPAPQSDPHAGHHMADEPRSSALGRTPIDLNVVEKVIAEHAMRDPYRLSFPKDAMGVYSAFTYPDQPEGQRTLYVDQYSGSVVGDVRFADYGIAAKAAELGVQLHMGNYFGRLNQIIMLIPCIAIVVLSVTGPYMWWRRRPQGEIGAPKAVSPVSMKTVALIVLVMGLVFPLAGLSLIVVAIGDRIFSKLVGNLRPAPSLTR